MDKETDTKSASTAAVPVGDGPVEWSPTAAGSGLVSAWWPAAAAGKDGAVLAWWVLVAVVACCVLSALKALLKIGVWVFLALVVIPFAYKYYDKKKKAEKAVAAAVTAAAVAAAAAEDDLGPPPPPPPAAATPAPPVGVDPSGDVVVIQQPAVAFPATAFY